MFEEIKEEQKAEREKRKQKIFWEKLTTILSDQKLSVWKALDKALKREFADLPYFEELNKVIHSF